MDEEVPVFFFDTMLRIRGTVCHHRMKTALKESRGHPKTVRIRMHRVQWHGEEPVLTPLSEVYLNMAAGNVLGKQRFHENAGFDPLFHVESYEGLLDVLADLLGREYMDSRDLYEQFAGNDFYDEVQKMCSIAASMATMVFNKAFQTNVFQYIAADPPSGFTDKKAKEELLNYTDILQAAVNKGL